MSRKNKYYLVGRYRKNNDFVVIPISGKWGNDLEEIDLYTTNYSNVLELVKALHVQGLIEDADIDFFIVSPKEKSLSFSDVLYKNSSKIRSIAKASLDGNIEEEDHNINDILNHFCWKMKYQPLFYNMVMYGDTHLYPKFIRYFTNKKYQDVYHVKYQDGGWVKKSYPLLRNIVDSFHQFDYSFGNNDTFALDYIYRNMLEESLMNVTDRNYDEKQSSIFDLTDSISDEEKEEYVLHTFKSLPRGVFYQQQNQVVYNEELFGNYDIDDLEKLSFLLGGRLSFLVQILSLHQYYYNEGLKEMRDVSEQEKLIEEDINHIKAMLEESPDLLNQAYQWSVIYDKYKSRIVGEENGYQFVKRKYS